MPFDNKEDQQAWAKQYREKNKKRIKLYQQNYNDVNHEVLAQKKRAYYEENKEYIEQKKSEWKAENREKVLTSKRKYNKKNREKVNRSSTEGRKERRLIVLLHYSNGKPMCACCGNNDYDKLTIDHIIPRSGEHLLKHMTGSRIYGWLINNNFPDGYQVLCASCNCSKKSGGSCNKH